MRILIFGDSIAHGFFDSQGGWVGRLASHYHQATLDNILDKKDNRIQIFNLGIPGNKSEDILNRLEAETNARSDPSHEIAIILAVGMPDAKMKNNIAAQDVYEFQEIYEKIIDKSKGLTDKVLCVGLTAVDEEQTNPWIYDDSAKQWSNTRINLFEDTIKQSAQRKEVAFVPVHDKFLRMLGDNRKLLADGLHPNDEGHEVIAAWVQPELEQLLQ